MQIDLIHPQYFISTEFDRNTTWRQVSSGAQMTTRGHFKPRLNTMLIVLKCQKVIILLFLLNKTLLAIRALIMSNLITVMLWKKFPLNKQIIAQLSQKDNYLC